MKQETMGIISLTAIELLKLIESTALKYELATSRDKARRFELYRTLEEQGLERSNYFEKIRYLRRRGMVRKFSEGKESFLELTEKGKKRIENYDFENMTIARPRKWDKKWRIVIFDIPEKRRGIRDSIRGKLYQIGFIQIQKSVFIFPFECTKEINSICDRLGGRKHIKYLIADIIEGEIETIEKFLDINILTKDDLK